MLRTFTARKLTTMQQNQNIDASVVLFEDRGDWIAHCLEYDIVAQGKTVELAKEAFKKIFVCQIILDKMNGNAPFSDWAKAPKEIWDMAKNATSWTREPLYIPDVPFNATLHEVVAIAA